MRNPTVIGAGAYGGAGGTVVDSPNPVYTLQAGTVDVTEGSPVSFTVARAGGLGLAGSVDWALTAGTPADFGGSLPSGHATFAAGATAFAVSLPTSGNSLVDSTRSFTVGLSNPGAGGTLGSPSSIVGTIADDDAAVANSWALFPDWTVNAKSHVDTGPAVAAWPLAPSAAYAQATLTGSATSYLNTGDQWPSTVLANGNLLVAGGDLTSPVTATMVVYELAGTPPATLTTTRRATFTTPPNLKPNCLLSINAKIANNVIGFYVNQTADARDSTRVMTSTDNGATFSLRTEQVFNLATADKLQAIGLLQLGPGYNGGGYTGLSTDWVYVYLGRVGNMATLYQAGADGSVYLGRVQIAGTGGALANLWDRTKYTFFNGTDGTGAPTWTATAPGAKVLPTPDIGKQYQVYWVPAPHNRFFGACFTSNTNLLIPESLTPWGPWGRVFSGAGSDPDWTGCFTASTPASWFDATGCYVMASGAPPDDLEVQRVPLTALP